MPIKIAINGYGRIGRNVLRAVYELNRRDEFQVVAINDMGKPEINAHITMHDTTHGPFGYAVDVREDGKAFIIDGDEIALLANRDPSQLDWGAHDVDVLMECTGAFTSIEKSTPHLNSGAKKVLISAPAGQDCPTVVYGVNHHTLKASDTIVSNASCTTNGLAPVAKVLDDAFGIESGLMNTIHAYTNDQCLIDVYHKDMRRARAATHSIIPTKTGAAAAVGLVLPKLKGKMDGFSVRVPVMNVSLVDLTVQLKQTATPEDIHQAMKTASEGELSGILAVNTLPLVSIDFNHNPASSIFDATQTKQMKGLTKVLAWYDNEWGFSVRMLDTARAMMEAK